MNAHRPSLDVSTWEGIAYAGTADASSWPVVGEENRGLREKRWVRSPDGSVWLRKRHRKSRPFEPAIEVFALELARACGIDSARALLASWPGDDATPARGVCVVNFLESGEELIGGARVLRRADPSYDPERREAHSLDRVVGALRENERAADCDLVEPFARVLLFDAWIGNGDRHPGNWSLIRRDGSLRLSPMYDPAGCLGAELLDGNALLTAPDDARLARYVARCPSGFGDGARLIGLAQVVERAASLGVLPRDLIGIFAQRLVDAVPALLETFEQRHLPTVRRQLILAILQRRLAWLRSVM